MTSIVPRLGIRLTKSPPGLVSAQSSVSYHFPKPSCPGMSYIISTSCLCRPILLIQILQTSTYFFYIYFLPLIPVVNPSFGSPAPKYCAPGPGFLRYGSEDYLLTFSAFQYQPNYDSGDCSSRTATWRVHANRCRRSVKQCRKVAPLPNGRSRPSMEVWENSKCVFVVMLEVEHAFKRITWMAAKNLSGLYS